MTPPIVLKLYMIGLYSVDIFVDQICVVVTLLAFLTYDLGLVGWPQLYGLT